MRPRFGNLLKLTAFRLSIQSLERLDEIVATNKKFSALHAFRPDENRSTVLRRLIDDAYTKVMAEKAAPPASSSAAKLTRKKPAKKERKK